MMESHQHSFSENPQQVLNLLEHTTNAFACGLCTPCGWRAQNSFIQQSIGRL